MEFKASDSFKHSIAMAFHDEVVSTIEKFLEDTGSRHDCVYSLVDEMITQFNIASSIGDLDGIIDTAIIRQNAAMHLPSTLGDKFDKYYWTSLWLWAYDLYTKQSTRCILDIEKE